MLPEGIPTVTVTGRYLFPDGRPLSGQVVWRAPSLLTFSDEDVILGGPVTVPLDEQGAFKVVLPATDAPGMSPDGWSYTVAEQFASVAQNRVYQILLPAESPVVDIADLAPTDPTTPNYVAVRGDSAYEVAVAEGFEGTVEQWLASLVGRGARAYSGSTAPASSLGLDGDTYAQYTTATYYGVTSTTLTPWAKSGGAWAKVGGAIRGAAIVVNAGATDSAPAADGDVLIRPDTGDVYQKTANSWGSPKGNIKGPKGDAGTQGPKGDTGAQGPQGPPGADGTGSGTVTAVNGVQPASGGNVTLNAGNVGALPLNGTAEDVLLTIKGNGTSGPVSLYGNKTDDKRFAMKSDGSWYSNGLTNTAYNMGIGDTTTQFGGGRFVLGVKNVDAVPTVTPTNGAILYASGGKLKVLQTDGATITVGEGGGAVASVNGKTGAVTLAASDVGALATTARAAANGVASLDDTSRVPIAQVPSAMGRNMWTPQALGFQAWSCDPAHVSNPTTTKAAVVQRLYLAGINITEPTQVNRVVIFARGWAGSTAVPAARFYAGIYNEAGSRVATSGQVSSLPAAGQITGTAPGANSNHIGAVPIPLTATATLQPGRYWAAFLLSAGSATDFYYMHVQNESPSAPANFFLGTAFQRAWCVNSQTSLPTTVNQANGEVGLDPAIMALAMV
ncbi:hypothetical protein ACOKM5_24180 [Streptomyces sp. BH097]|uniref:hypothetical protein n=1 Tax=Streptomyces sp. BH097 TaxID=3410406 RepID=UPI003CF24EE3